MLDHLSGYQPKRKILLIEDDPSYARLVEILLEESDLLDCFITNKQTLEEGLVELQNTRDYDAVLLDLSLPDSNGFSTLEKLIFNFPNQTIIVLTGRADKELGIKSVKAGAQDFLVKGEFDGEGLAKTLRFSIERKNIKIRLEETQRLAKMGTWECNTGTHAFFASDEVYHIFGIEAIKRSFSCESIHQPGNPLYLLGQTHKEATQQQRIKKEARITLPDGSARNVMLWCEATPIENNAHVFSGIIQDITERIRNEELKKEKDLAEQSAKVREQVIASVSHEMRTPMNAILGMSNLLLNSSLDVEQISFAESIKQSSETLLGIINDILQMSTINNSRIEFEKEAFSLQKLLENFMKAIRYKGTEKNLSIELNLPNDLPPILIGDKLRLKQVLYNLVGNAIKFTDEGSITIDIEKVFQENQQVKLRFIVSDTGIGIPQDRLIDIFESFTRLQTKDRLFEGTGLGLTIAKALTEQQGGKIWATSQLGKGSQFYFELTFTSKDQLDKGTPKKKFAIPELDPQTRFRIMVVEDHKMNQLVVSKTLEKKWKNAEIMIANNGDEAIELLQEELVDIILMDIQMPGKNGFETTAYIRNQMPKMARVPILAMTAHVNITEQNIYSKKGMDDFVLKPFVPEQLFDKIAHYLNKRPK